MIHSLVRVGPASQQVAVQVIALICAELVIAHRIAAMALDQAEWKQEFELQKELFEKHAATMPPTLVLQRELLMSRV